MDQAITRNTPVTELTVCKLADYLRALDGQAPSGSNPQEGKRYVYGLRGIMQLFGVSNVTAQRYKRGLIKDAVSQNGRKIIVDVDRALELFNASEDK